MKENYFLFVDTEFTREKFSGIFECGLLLCDGDMNIIDVYDSRHKPEQPLDYRHTRLTGISNEDLRYAPHTSVLKEVWIKMLKEYNPTIVAYGIAEKNIFEPISNYLDEGKLKILTFNYLDISAEYVNAGRSATDTRYPMAYLCKFLGVQLKAHKAYDDAAALRESFIKLREGFDQKAYLEFCERQAKEDKIAYCNEWEQKGVTGIHEKPWLYSACRFIVENFTEEVDKIKFFLENVKIYPLIGDSWENISVNYDIKAVRRVARIFGQGPYYCLYQKATLGYIQSSNIREWDNIMNRLLEVKKRLVEAGEFHSAMTLTEEDFVDR